MNTQVPVVETPASPAVETPIAEKPATEKPAEAKSPETPKPAAERTWSEEIEVAGNELVEAVKEIVAEGNVRRLILHTPDYSLSIEIPLVAGAVVGGVLAIFAPLLALLAAIATIIARVKIEIVRVEEPTPKA